MFLFGAILPILYFYVEMPDLFWAKHGNSISLIYCFTVAIARQTQQNVPL